MPTVHLLHIGKTGGTALKHALGSVADRPGRLILKLRRHGTTLRDVPPGDRVIFFLRDPVSRFISGFCSRQREGRPRYLFPHTEGERLAFATFQNPNDLALALSSVDPVRKERAFAAMREIGHVKHGYARWLHSADSLRARVADLFFIGWQETLADDFALLKAKLSLDPRLRLPDDEITAHRSPPDVARRLDDVATQNLRSWYADDYALIRECRRLLAEHPRLRDAGAKL